jgi:hypothetical protein
MSLELLGYLNKLHDQAIEFLRDVRFDKQPQRDGYVVCLYASMIELAGGIVVLVSRDRKTSVSPVCRTLLEAYVDFKNAIKSSTYIRHAYAQHDKDWIKVLSERPNPFLAAVLDDEERGAALERHKRDLAKLKGQGIKPLKVAEKFDRAEMADEYRSIYHFESDATHNSWQALLSRHFEKSDDGFQLTLYKQRSFDDYRTYLDSAAVLLLDATNEIHERFKSGHQQRIEELRQELAILRTATS